MHCGSAPALRSRRRIQIDNLAVRLCEGNHFKYIPRERVRALTLRDSRERGRGRRSPREGSVGPYR